MSEPKTLGEILYPLIEIARLYENDDLNDRDPKDIIIFCGKGGKVRLTLADCLMARSFLWIFQYQQIGQCGKGDAMMNMPLTPVFRFEGELGGRGDNDANRDKDSILVALTVGLGRLPTNVEVKALSEHLHKIATLMID